MYLHSGVELLSAYFGTLAPSLLGTLFGVYFFFLNRIKDGPPDRGICSFHCASENRVDQVPCWCKVVVHSALQWKTLPLPCPSSWQSCADMSHGSH